MGYPSGMQLTVDDSLLRGVDLTPAQVQLDLAVGLYTEGRVTLGRAASVAGLPQEEFLRELGRRRVPVHYSAADFDDDCRRMRESGLL